MSLDEACRLSELYDPAKAFVVSRYLDVKDQNVWRVAVVTGVSNSAVSIHYEAWAYKYDEQNLPLTSPRLALFRRCTSGYTGQERQAYRPFKFSPEKHAQYELRLQQILANEGTVESAEEFTQFLRGELFFYVDSLLTLSHHSLPDESAVDSIFRLMEQVFALVTLWAKAFPGTRREYELLSLHSKLYLVHPAAAFVACYPELAEMLKSCFGMNKRTCDTFKVCPIANPP